MKKYNLFAILILITFIANSQNSKDNFYGMWILDIDVDNNTVGWLDVNTKNGFLDSSLLWRWGSVDKVSNVYFIDENNLVVTQTRERTVYKEGNKEFTHAITEIYNFKRKGDQLEGILIVPERNGMGIKTTKFKGWKLSDVPNTPDLSKIKYGKTQSLFNGKDLKGWELIDPKQVNGFKVANGVLVNNPVQIKGKKVHYGNIRTVQKFKDFNLKLDVNVPKHSNSGIYLRGMYEIQVFDSYGKELDSHNMGALYSRITPSQSAEKPAGEWQTMDITLYKRHLTVILNGKTIINNQPVFGPTGGAIQSDVFKSGPIYIQGDHGKISYKNIMLTPIVE